MWVKKIWGKRYVKSWTYVLFFENLLDIIKIYFMNLMLVYIL